MKVKATVIDELLSSLRLFAKKSFTRREVDENPPLRAELFSTEQLEEHALKLARHHRVSTKLSVEVLLKELAENEQILYQVNELLQDNVRDKKSISPAAEWILDNYYLIEEQIRTTQRHLPKGYSKGLPKLNSGAWKNFPRVYSLAIEIISHSDGHIDIPRLQGFITAYQRESHLTLGELWAFPIMLRLALIENLGRVAARIAVDINDAALANSWAKEIIETAEHRAKDLVLVIADMARSKPPLVTAFVAEFSRKLQWKGTELSLPLHWVEQQLVGTTETVASMVLTENQNRAADQVSVSNSINSLRVLAKTDWRDFVESMSIVEHILRNDVHGVYAAMDFHTRDLYRHKVEYLATHSRLSEGDVARIAIDLARKSSAENGDDFRKAHVGYYLLDAGLRETEKSIRVKLPLGLAFQKRMERSVGIIYAVTIFLFTSLIGSGLIAAAAFSVQGLVRILIAILCLISASQMALAIANWWATFWIKPTALPKLNFSEGIPFNNRTMVVVPTLLIDLNTVEKLVEDLEVRFLSNRDPNLLFGLLTDFRDASTETTAGDAALVALVKSRIVSLNTRYGQLGNDSFFLFHRPRRWNKTEKKWIGYERKRGKLADLNRVLQGKSTDRFSVVVGEEQSFKTVKYVITLDTDTQLPREAAWKLVGTMAHPLNRPVFDEKKKRVTEGYTIIQPRIAISLHGATRSGFTRMHESDAGIDPYTRITSDVYQDLFKEGSFIGKGIYDVDVFEKVLNNRFPENRILSHDLLEGSYTRCGFASDIQFYEDYPSRYQIDISRKHRWIRGDWQIGNWFLPVVPAFGERWEKNPLPALSRWKIFDNLRRSLVPIAHFLLLVAGWTVLSAPLFWTLAIVGIALLPSVLTSLWSGVQKPKEIGISQHINNTVGITSKSILQSLFYLVCLPYEAWINADAISRTLWRLWFTRRNLLQWNPSSMQRILRPGVMSSYRTMWVAPTLAVGVAVFLLTNSLIVSFLIALPVLGCWALAPAVVAFLNRPLATAKGNLDNDEKAYLRELARKSWQFFEDTIGERDHWLPPDNLQQYPSAVIAHRTSPTNIGLSLLANLSAHDFGFITTTQLIERTTHTFRTLRKMERYRGHFYNWYDTETLSILKPPYISTVDSGNLAGHLLTLRQGLLQLAHQKILETKVLSGLQDTLRIVLQDMPPNDHGVAVWLRVLHDQLLNSSQQLPELKAHLESALEEFREQVSLLSFEEKKRAIIFERHVQSLLDEITAWAPWTEGAIPERCKRIKIVGGVFSTHELAIMDGQTEPKEGMDAEISDEEKLWLDQFHEQVLAVRLHARARLEVLQQLAQACNEFSDMEYDFLYGKSQKLLSIGYHVTDHQQDSSYYDLLASEARLSSFVAIAQGKIPQESWFAMGRRLTSAGNTPVLLSWSGSMFEYLMPALVMPTYENTLLDEMGRGTVTKQIEYGEQRGVPWGISESCYNLVDAHLTYQYRAFGIPGLGFKRGLGQDLVVAPYATVLALMIEPQKAYQNLMLMKSKGFEGEFGFYEAIDYTPSRLSHHQRHAVIKTYMVHHLGMSLLALEYLLLDRPMQKRFEADTQFQTALLLLQEQVPKSVGFYAGSSDHKEIVSAAGVSEVRMINTPDTPVPEVQLLSNGNYFLMISNSGGGYSRWRDLAVTRWREDTTCDHWGSFCYVHDRDENRLWSNAYQPTHKVADSYEAIFSQGKAEFRRRDGQIETYTTIIVSPEHDIEVRRVQISNHSKGEKRLSATSYAEVVLAATSADDSHPVFSNLFVQTEINEHQHAILCTRRPRSKEENPPWMFHLMKATGGEVEKISFETDRASFIGRGNTLADPQALQHSKPLSGAQGSVLDPIAAIQYQFTLQAGESVTLDLVTGISDTRASTQGLIDKYQDRHLRDRAFELSWTHSQVMLRQIGATEADAQLYGRLASSILYLNADLRSEPGIVKKNQRQQSALWSHSISGDLPIALLMISDAGNFNLVTQLIKAKAYWQMKGLAVDLVILNEDQGGYRQALQDQIQGLITAGVGLTSTEKQGRIFVRPIDQVSTEDRLLFQAVARIVISDRNGSLEVQLARQQIRKTSKRKLITTTKIVDVNSDPVRLPDDLLFSNGTGGFAVSGRTYELISEKKKKTPLPWINVLANPRFGTLVSESGSSYTWFENAHEFRLTPWTNDPLLNETGEAFYIRDEESGHFWSPLGLPAHSTSAYVVTHGFGYSHFKHKEGSVLSEVTIHVDKELPVKFTSITITNDSDRPRVLSVTGYVEWVLGELRSKTCMHHVVEYDPQLNALVARNRFNADFQQYVAFFEVDQGIHSYTSDRTEFIGRNRTLRDPDAMRQSQMSGKSGACLDACAALMVPVSLQPGKTITLTFKLGAGASIQDITVMLAALKNKQAAAQSLADVKDYWNGVLGMVQITTPDPAMDLLANGWLLYQVMSCRLWGRSGLYQSGGAFGFRDQLQDTLAVMHAQPSLTRQQVILCASRQFKEGDVQHWWHPPTSRGVRTLCSDDYLWLPFVTCRYVSTTGDSTVLKEVVPFLEGRKLNAGEESYYDLPVTSDRQASVYDHCKQAILHALRLGEHGIPLMGSGDWNDGMNMVGIHGQGESVWLGFFLYDVLNRFATIASLQSDLEFAGICEQHAKKLRSSIEDHAWDGQWYLRAYFDNGSPLGSKSNTECKIDAISQSWAVLSGAGEPQKTQTAMQSVNTHLINREKGIIQLLDPPFDKADMNPGYIKGYVPGVRENGGQYTHAAIWMVMAFAKLGDREKTFELLRMINPVSHTTTNKDVQSYKTEPYVMAADVYGVTPHTGRGGWTWYTGSAGWMYQLILESFLGLHREGDRIRFIPCVPDFWKSYEVRYRYLETQYLISVVQEKAIIATVRVDGVLQTTPEIRLVNDGGDHQVVVSVPS